MMALKKLKSSSWTSIIGMMIENVHIGLCDGSDKKKGPSWTCMMVSVREMVQVTKFRAFAA